MDSIIQSNYRYDIIYGYQDQRTVTKLMNGSGALLKKVIYAGLYEKEVVTGDYDRHIYYIYGGDGLAAIYSLKNGANTMCYIHKDHLGSFDKITNASTAMVDSCSYDAFGRKRNPGNWTYDNLPVNLFSRGFTGHENLDNFGSINMPARRSQSAGGNGRVYDPLLGRFLSADPYVANPFSTQDYNRYSYVVNNPLRFTDPSGYMTQKEFDNIIDRLLDSGFGGEWNERSGLHYYSEKEAADKVESLGGGTVVQGAYLRWSPYRLPRLYHWRRKLNGTYTAKAKYGLFDVDKDHYYVVNFNVDPFNPFLGDDCSAIGGVEPGLSFDQVADDIRRNGENRFIEYVISPHYGGAFFVKAVENYSPQNFQNWKLTPESVNFGRKVGRWGHQYFPNPNYGELRHIIGSYVIAEKYDPFIAYNVTWGNEYIGLSLDIRNLRSRLNGSEWAFQYSDVLNNYKGIWYSLKY